MPAAAKKRAIPFQLHPRVFAALGADLVTNDFVAITELVKNAYDAFADRVDVRFGSDPQTGEFIEILDNGQGMDGDTIESVWCVVATPFRAESPVSRRGSKTRRVAGEKGLGRLSVARLGARLEMLTQARGGPCLRIDVKWPALAKAPDISKCHVELSDYDSASPFSRSGTRLRIFDLVSDWSDDRIDELREHLSRLLSPFSGVDDFEIRLGRGTDANTAVRIESPGFLKKPVYRLAGELSDVGALKCKYRFTPVDADGAAGRTSSITVPWSDIREHSKRTPQFMKDLDEPNCGPFSFELRAWEIGPEDVNQIAERFEVRRSIVRASIRAHKGISVYRDGILVLPKSEGTRDWLGLDIRAISEYGNRLRTSQLVGYVSITAEDNPRIKDTSDRERLAESREVTVFEEVIKAAVEVLERERQKDRLEQKTAEKKLDNLFGGMSAESLTKEVSAIAKRDGTAAEILPLVNEFGRELEKGRKEIERRFIYYSRLATVGTLAQMLVHEVRNKTTVIGGFLSAVSSDQIVESLTEPMKQKLTRATSAVTGLDRLAETFAPLASRSFGRGRRTSPLEERIRGALDLLEPEITKQSIQVKFTSKSVTEVTVDPGELDAVLLNLFDNAVYWLSRTKTKEERFLEIRVQRSRSGERVKVLVHDSGPGIEDDDAERIFWPGVTSKPGGIGMGLTIASEIVDAYDGKMALVQPGELEGASFEFDLPIYQK